MLPSRIKQEFTTSSINEIRDWASVIILENDIESYDGQMALAVTVSELLSEPYLWMHINTKGFPEVCQKDAQGAFPVYAIPDHHPETHEADA